MQELQQLRTELERRKGRRDQIQEQLDKNSKNLRILKREVRFTEQAQVLIQQVAQITQQELEYHISELVTLALESIFPDPYELKVKFVIRRGKTEADIVFRRDGEEVDPLSASGGGVVDVASFALRVALWRLSHGLRPVLVLDEPFRYLSEQYIPLAGQILKDLSSKLNLQVIMVTHSRELMEYADQTFEISQRKGVSNISYGSSKYG